jgi:subtilisin family serine protease
MRAWQKVLAGLATCALLLAVAPAAVEADPQDDSEATPSMSTTTTSPEATTTSSTSTIPPSGGDASEAPVEPVPGDVDGTTSEDDSPPTELLAQTIDGETVSVVAPIDSADDVVALQTELAGTDFTIRHVFDDLVALEVDSEALRRASASEVVGPVSADTPLEVFLDDSTEVVGARRAWQADLDGSGSRIAVIDSGVDATHPTFVGAVDGDAEGCFVSWDAEHKCGPTRTADSATGPGAAAPCTGSNCAHGTHVASIAAGRGGLGAPPGVAPGAELVPLRIFGVDPADDRMKAATSDLVAALDHIIAEDAIEPIHVVNLSLGAGAFAPGCVPPTSQPDLVAASERITTLIDDRNVAVVAATGNGGLYRQSSFPACLEGVVPVVAVGSFDIVADFSNSVDALAAPGVDVLAAVPGGATRMSGTSMAAPHVSGAIAIVNQADPIWNLPGHHWLNLAQTGAHALDVDDEFRDIWRIDVAAALDLRPRPAFGMRAISSSGRVSILESPDPNAFFGQAFGWPERAVGSALAEHGGVWVVTNRGRVTSGNHAPHYGDRFFDHLNAPIIAMAPTATGRGYYLLAEDGGVFTFGDARFYGSTGNMRLNAPVTDMTVTPSGRGYWLTAKDGGVFTFGDARFYGSTGSMRLNQPVVSMDATASGRGYWLVALDGGIFTFGDARFYGSLPGVGVTNETGYRIRDTSGGRGYYISTLEGGIYPFGNATWFGHADLQAGHQLVEIIPLEGD